MDTVTARIPKDGFFTLFVEGSLIKISDMESEYLAEYKKGILLLYYHFPFHRRVYITCTPELFSSCFLHRFDNVDTDLSVLAQFRGRNFDRLKQAADYLNHTTSGAFYQYPPAFWLQLACLIREGKDALCNFRQLVHWYDPSREIPEYYQWQHG